MSTAQKLDILNVDRVDALQRFKFQDVLNIDQSSRRIILRGTIDEQDAIVLVERAAFSEDSQKYLFYFADLLTQIRLLNGNDIYSWFMASNKIGVEAENAVKNSTRKQKKDQINTPNNDGPSEPVESSTEPSSTDSPNDELSPPGLKVNLIWPCNSKHIRKYSRQHVRTVTETPEIYRKYIKHAMEEDRNLGRVQWVYNILDGITEQDEILYQDDGFLMIPDLNWDCTTLPSLHLLALTTRRDWWSIRDLKASDIDFLRQMKESILHATTEKYPGVERDQLKLYFHYQPTYYHLHIHIIHVEADVGGSQAIGKAIPYDTVLEYLSLMKGEGASMADISLTYTLGEETDLWNRIFKPLKEGLEPAISIFKV